MTTENSMRGLAAGFAACGVAMAALLVSHPGGGGGASFAEVLRAEAGGKVLDAIVHGGFIVTLCVLTVCFTLWSRTLGTQRLAVVVGMVTFCAGSGLLIGSMILDGFVSPALAAQFVAEPGTDGLGLARTLLSFCGTVIGFLMSMGLALQSVAVLSWSVVLLDGGRAQRVVGVFGIGCAVVVLAAFLAFTKLSAHVILGAILGHVVWYIGLAVALAQKSRPSVIQPRDADSVAVCGMSEPDRQPTQRARRT